MNQVRIKEISIILIFNEHKKETKKMKKNMTPSINNSHSEHISCFEKFKEKKFIYFLKNFHFINNETYYRNIINLVFRFRIRSACIHSL